MHIENLSLYNFKNYEEANFEFSNKINCLVGPNGSGKTNVLDAIHYLSLTKSAFNTIDSQNVYFGESAFSVKGKWFVADKNHVVLCAYDNRTKKIFKVNKKEYDKLSDHIGRFPIVLITPNDNDLIRDSSEIRRKFFDSIISQTNNEYLKVLIKYNHVLKQRNQYLKSSGNGTLDLALLSIYDQTLINEGGKLSEWRKSFIDEYGPHLIKSYQFLSENKEEVSISYKSDCSKPDFAQQFKNALSKDRILERTTLGVHRDDYKFFIKDAQLKKFGSQGQQKTFVIAMKLAQYELVKVNTEIEPLLLLDDIFDKLDSDRINKLLELISDNSFGQIFITDAREERTRSILDRLNIEARMFNIYNGNIST